MRENLRLKSLGEMCMESGRTHSNRHERNARYQPPPSGPCEVVRPDGSSTFWPSWADAMAHRGPLDVVAELAPGERLTASTATPAEA